MKALVPLIAILLLTAGCATTRVDWSSRIGTYSYDEAVLEMGVPERQATLSDGTIVAEWLQYRGTTYVTPSFYSYGYPYRYRYSRFHMYDVDQFPDRYVRLVFDPDGKLNRVEEVAR